MGKLLERVWIAGTPAEGSCYKSTLIVPITLSTNQLDHAFVQSLINDFDMVEFSRVIFAFSMLRSQMKKET
jgi:hypothetical protein